MFPYALGPYLVDDEFPPLEFKKTEGRCGVPQGVPCLMPL